MKISRIILSASLFLSFSTAFAYNKVTCSKDERPVDGSLVEISITKNLDNNPSHHNQYYEVKRRIASSEMMDYSDDNTRTIGGIICKEYNLDISCRDFTKLTGLLTKETNEGKKYSFYMTVDTHLNKSTTETYTFSENQCVFE